MRLYFRKYIWAFCVAGFFFGILYSNCVAKEYILSLAVFDPYYLNQFAQSGVPEISYLFYVMRIRIVPFLLLYVLRSSRYFRFFASAFLVWTGFLCGVMFTAAAIKLGVKGIFFSLCMVLPHGIFYAFGYTLFICYLDGVYKKYIEFNKTFIFFFIICAGIILECYINPYFVKIFAKMI